MSQPWFVLLESNSSGTGRLFPAAAKRLGLRPILLTDKASRYPYLSADQVEHRELRTDNRHELVAILSGLRHEAPIAGIFSSSEYFVETAAALSAELGLAGANPAAVARCRNKWEQRKTLAAAGFSMPRFSRIADPYEAMNALNLYTLPVIVKPTMGTGSIGVKLCYTSDEVRRHCELLLSRRTNERGLPIQPIALMEEYVTGVEYSLESFGRETIGITRKHVSPEPYFIETGHDFPARLAPEEAARAANAVLAAVEALELAWGPIHTEFRLTTRDPVVIEVNPRLAGGFIPELVRMAMGVDLIEATVALAAGRSPCVRPTRSLYASIRFLICPGEGQIAGVDGLSEAESIESIAAVQLYKQPGDKCRIEHDFRDRIGHVIACSPSGTVAANTAEQARRQISFELAAPLVGRA